MSAGPIFVHSLFRSGSTFLFGVFRRSTEGYWCYQEPLNEHLRHVADAPERLLEIHWRAGSLLRHPNLDKPYFWEFYQVRDAIATLFRKEFSYDGFFMTREDPSFRDLMVYLQALIDNANGRPFFQCCRTTGRVAALRDTFDGTQIHLWRNPHDQWWSYQVGDYFDATTQLIFNAADLPAPLAAVRAFCGIAGFHDRDIEKELAHARHHRLPAREDYVSFYALWLYSMLACESAADLSVNIDALSTSSAYRQHILDTLARAGIEGVDLSDCDIARAPFGVADLAFFTEAEDRVHGIFRDHGIASEALTAAIELRTRHSPASPPRDRGGAASRLRDVAVRQMDALAQTQRELADANRIAELQRIDLDAATTMAATQRERLVAAEAALAARERDLAEALDQSAALASDLDAREKDLADALDRSTALASELAQTHTRNATLSAGLESIGAELALARQRLERLRDELRTAGVRLADAQQETHRWWSVADDTGRHLNAIYSSRSWRLTRPLREINAWRKRVAGSAAVGVAALDSMPRRAVRGMLLAAWAHVRGRPERRARFVRLLAPFPRLYDRLRAFAFAHAPARRVTEPSPPRVAASSPLESGNGIRWSDYPRSVQEIHSQLMRARAATAKATSQTLPGQTPR